MQALRKLFSSRFAISLPALSLALLIVVALGFGLVLNLNHATASDDVTQAFATSFTYQGRLTVGNNPVTGPYDFQFDLYDAETGGNSGGATQVKSNTTVSNSVFTVVLDFGAGAFTGAPRWLEIAVRPAGSGDFVRLGPRQPLTPVPYAMSVPWSGIADMPADFKDGVDNVGAGGGGITGVTAGAGLTGGGTSGNVPLSVNFGSDGSAATAARSDHMHGGAVWTTSNNLGLSVSSTANNGISVFAYNGNVTPSSNIPIGVYGATTATPGKGVQGDALAASGENFGVIGVTLSSAGYGVFGRNLASNLSSGCCAFGLFGRSDANGGNATDNYAAGVKGYAANANGKNYGVAGFTDSASGAGVFGQNNATGGKAAIFVGDVDVQGRITKTSISFKIDHPLDPENKYLYHSVVESPDMMNIYNGNAILDNNGEALVQMPAWFEALNMEFRYQLTAIGVPGPNLYIAQEIASNQFKIAGGQANMKVSWQVTGIRNDPYARTHRIAVEEEKPPTERGTYLYATEAGQPESRALYYHTGQPRDPALLAGNSSTAAGATSTEPAQDNQ